ncbi:MAG: ankyrin repeat domain-containing protein [Proteobacteria bacterium]|nr:ankyrin repeat domain-containing protein [Pseudomonadota bacterium]
MTGERDEELLRRYREASDAQGAAPSERVRTAILGEGRAAAERYAVQTQASAAELDTVALRSHQPPRRRWMYTLIGTASAAVLVGILVLPRFLSEDTREKAVVRAAPRITAKQEVAQDSAGVGGTAASAPLSESALATAAAPAPGPAPLPASAKKAETAASEAQASDTQAGALNERAQGHVDKERNEAEARRTSSPAPLFAAVRAGDVTQLRQALQADTAVDSRDAQGRTPLLLATELGRDAMVKELLDHGADPEAADAAGRTPLQLARQLQRADLIELLERAGARR